MNITDDIWAWARKSPDAPAILTARGTLSFAELDRAVSAGVRAFSEAGLKPGDRAGIHSQNQIQYLITFLALARMGVALFAFRFNDAARNRQQLARGLKISVIVTDAQSKWDAAAFSFVPPPPGRLAQLKEFSVADCPGAEDGDLPFLFVATSGSTGTPKLGVSPHKQYRPRLIPSAHEPAGPGTRLLSMINLTFLGATQLAFRCLAAGGCVCLYLGGKIEGLVRFIAGQDINYLFSTPAHASLLLDITKEGKVLFPELAAYRIGTAMVPEELRKRIQQLITPNLYIAYGITEISGVAMAPPNLVRNVAGVVGSIEPGVELLITDADGNPLAPGEAGRVRLKSPGMLTGYIDAPEETAAAFKDGWFHSGDIAELTSDGLLIHHGRSDDLMIFDGINIFPAEIEHALLQNPAVAEAASFPVDAGARGEMPYAAAVVNSPISPKRLLTHCRSILGARAPRRVVIVPKLPTSSDGSVQKNALSEFYEKRNKKPVQE